MKFLEKNLFKNINNSQKYIRKFLGELLFHHNIMAIKILAVVVFGNTGSGKSTLSNTLVGIENDFKESEDVESETMEMRGKNGIFDNQSTFVIDTSGIYRLDAPHLVAITQYKKEYKEVKAFTIVISF